MSRLAVGALGASPAAEPDGWTAVASLRRSRRSRGAHVLTHSSPLALSMQESRSPAARRAAPHRCACAVAGTAAPDGICSLDALGLFAYTALFILLLR